MCKKKQLWLNLALSTKMTLIQAQVLLRQTQMWTVQCCVARNCRRRSVARYKGVAKVTSGRTRKSFQLRYNPHNHWIAALYRNSAYLQYTDGTNIVVNINHDDAAGFSLDTHNSLTSSHCVARKSLTPTLIM